MTTEGMANRRSVAILATLGIVLGFVRCNSTSPARTADDADMGMGGASGATLACSRLTATDACDKCSNDQCCSEVSACMSDTSCASAADTWDSCWAGKSATTACDTAFANTGYLARAWLGCLSAKCAGPCESSDAGVGCVPDDATDPCDVCGSANCCAESVTCLLSTACSKASDQWDTCSQSASASATCDTQFAASGTEAKAWYTCLAKSCAAQCEL